MAKKVSVPISNDFCPQALYLYGTYKEDGAPNFGLFCWYSYCWDTELHVMACIGGDKLTKDLIREKGVFSANLVNEELLPLADHFGNKEGYAPGKMDILDTSKVIPGEKLNVPVLTDSPWSFELEVKQTIPLDGSELYICAVRNVLADERLAAPGKDPAELIRETAPVLTASSVPCNYYGIGKKLGNWGDWKDAF